VAPATAQAADARFATFKASLNRGSAGQLVTDLSNASADTVRVRQARNVAEVIQRAAPDVLLVNEFDFVAGGQAARLFRDNFLAVSQNGAPAADYPYFFVAPSNTGVPSGFDLDDSGDANPNDPNNDASALFVVAGDQNSDPLDGDSLSDADGNPIAIQPLLNSPRVNSRSTPDSAGAAEAALQGGANTAHLGDPRFDTADFSDTAPGNLRADYVLPSRQIKVVDSAVFWPVRSDPLFRLTGVFDNATWGGPDGVGGFPTSDHRLVWADLDLPGVH
jgi:hypothetical protein